MFYVTFNNTNTVDLDIKAIKRHSVPITSFKYKEDEAEGINGKYITEYENVEDIEIIVSFNFLYSNDDDFNYKKRLIKKWLRKVNDNKLSFSEDEDYYYKVKRLEVSNIEREIGIANFEVSFICEGYEYSASGCRLIKINKNHVVFNTGVKSLPILRVVGEGNTTITFNDKSFSLNVGQEVIVNSEEELCYKDGRIVTNIMSGKFPYLNEGKNTINWTGENIQIYIQTNLRDY
ncbi:distal tail protein Dit [Clostridium perfringens]|uniref:distal tail protein Dit n=1 Tax=Clostridium perfringens TaxID=1502 RepID=UPI002ED48B46|nr:distal tail protein Dit [Clostridium perfringens]